MVTRGNMTNSIRVRCQVGLPISQVLQVMSQGPGEDNTTIRLRLHMPSVSSVVAWEANTQPVQASLVGRELEPISAGRQRWVEAAGKR